jgi:hypothetical protein
VINREQEQLLDEAAALIRAWQDRGTKLGDALIALITEATELAVYGNVAPDVLLQMVARAYSEWAFRMASDIEPKKT